MGDYRLYEVLDARQLTIDNVEAHIGAWDARAVAGFLEVAIPQANAVVRETTEGGLFRFDASVDLSGDDSMCGNPWCRFEQAEELARFAALYADTVYITNPFAKYEHHLSEFASRNPESVKRLLVGDLMVLLYLRPLIEAGLVGLRESVSDFCPDCRARISGPDVDLAAALARLESELRDTYLDECTFELGRDLADPADFAITVRGPEELVHHGHVLQLYTETEIRSAGIDPTRLPAKESLSAEVLGRLDMPNIAFEHVTASLALQAFFTKLHHTTLLTNNEREVEFVNSVASPRHAQRSRDLLRGLRHAVPEVFAKDIGDLVAIRNGEGDLFAEYRGALSKAIRESESAVGSDLPTLVSDTILPEVSRISRQLKSSRVLRKKRHRNDIMIRAGVLGVGVFTSALMPGSDALAGALTAFAVDAAVRAAHAVAPEAEDPEPDSHYYFLWKATQ